MAATLLVEPVNVPAHGGLSGSAPVRALAALVCVRCGGRVLVDPDPRLLAGLADRLAGVHLCAAGL